MSERTRKHGKQAGRIGREDRKPRHTEWSIKRKEVDRELIENCFSFFGPPDNHYYITKEGKDGGSKERREKERKRRHKEGREKWRENRKKEGGKKRQDIKKEGENGGNTERRK